MSSTPPMSSPDAAHRIAISIRNAFAAYADRTGHHFNSLNDPDGTWRGEIDFDGEDFDLLGAVGDALAELAREPSPQPLP